MRKHFGIAAAISAVGLMLSAPIQAQDLTKARYIAANCANCHGTEGRSAGGIPSLAGYSRDQFIRTMKEYKDGTRPASIMHQLSKGYTDEQIEQLATFFASQPK
jgi:cytochrome subunit of sulfide dehydrogenase